VNKSEIRKKILNLRKKNFRKDLKMNFKILFNILKKEKNFGKTIGGYYPYNYEIDILKILHDFEKKNYLITLPKISKNSKMDFFKWSTNDPLKINKFGIPEPISQKIRHPKILLIPLIAFDKNLNRVGYGGGFYDRYISRIRKDKRILKIGIAYSFQKVKKIITNKYDIKLDYIITEKQ